MNTIEPNIFPITNLHELSTRYRKYRVRGLRRDSTDYFKNANLIVKRLSYQLSAPVEVYEIGDEVQLAVPEDAPELPNSLMMVAAPIRLNPVDGVHVLDYTVRNPTNDRLCLRFINFVVQAPLRSRLALWQPRSGAGFYNKQPTGAGGGIGRHEGFTVRAMITGDGGIGLCTDAKSCFVDQRPLSPRTSRSDFRKLKGRHAVYRYGHQWFDVLLFERHDLNVTEFEVNLNGRLISLAEYIETNSRKPIPPELADLDPAGSVVMYRNNRGEERAAPAALCYLTHDTESREVRAAHRQTIMPPHERRNKIHSIRNGYLSDIRFGRVQLRLSSTPLPIKRRQFAVPDLEFGNGQILSVRGTQSAQKTSFQDFGLKRRELLSNANAGFHVRSRLDRQYLILPKAVADSWGAQFINDVTRSVTELYPHGGYSPQVVVYNDIGVGRNFVDQANAILATAEANCTQPGFAVVMIRETTRGGRQAHDQLEAVILRKFPKLMPSIRAAVIHTTKGTESYEAFTDASGSPAYRIRTDKRSSFIGYLRNVALSKVLLTNEKWPFVLADPLHADLTIGIDVKHHTVGYTVVSSGGRSIRMHSESSRQKEKLLSEQIKSQLQSIIREEFSDHGRSFRSVVIHRDGRAFPEECAGAEDAMACLRAEGVLLPDATLAILSVAKSEPSMLRLFEVRHGSGRDPFVVNPQVGSYYITGPDAYLCTTGWPFRRPGTSRPLHVQYVQGGLQFEQCLEDIYRLSVLTWGRPEDCSRLPITIKLTDRALGEDATEYDEDALKFGISTTRATA